MTNHFLIVIVLLAELDFVVGIVVAILNWLGFDYTIAVAMVAAWFVVVAFFVAVVDVAAF